jgi:hypothetical protein
LPKTTTSVIHSAEPVKKAVKCIKMLLTCERNALTGHRREEKRREEKAPAASPEQ